MIGARLVTRSNFTGGAALGKCPGFSHAEMYLRSPSARHHSIGERHEWSVVRGVRVCESSVHYHIRADSATIGTRHLGVTMTFDVASERHIRPSRKLHRPRGRVDESQLRLL